MSKPIYKQGKMIRSISEFDQSDAKYFKVRFGQNFKTMHRSFLISWQYRQLLKFIGSGWIFEAEFTDEYKEKLLEEQKVKI